MLVRFMDNVLMKMESVSRAEMIVLSQVNVKYMGCAMQSKGSAKLFLMRVALCQTLVYCKENANRMAESV
jgi:hypothetical protein